MRLLLHYTLNMSNIFYFYYCTSVNLFHGNVERFHFLLLSPKPGFFFLPSVGSNIKAIPPASSISRVICDAISAEQSSRVYIIYVYSYSCVADHESRLHHDLLLKMRSSSRKNASAQNLWAADLVSRVALFIFNAPRTASTSRYELCSAFKNLICCARKVNVENSRWKHIFNYRRWMRLKVAHDEVVMVAMELFLEDQGFKL